MDHNMNPNMWEGMTMGTYSREIYVKVATADKGVKHDAKFFIAK